ncbi:hypothetical protein HX045_08525 [Myroides odoratimimus]|uniref:Uncharacterized protein n=1 Tax=Myroides odoratimimus CCUG 10230 TaxID=883150 RepID=A0ABN0EES0_9FLAO|nr:MULTISPECIES: hypothetical protein [Myroides]AJA69460.1 hypothetical protein MYRA21_2335 [Myroides sp. A21]EHO12834.1 hypothetical protein HMPREF9714_01204 [Myroides odoratimimus CCUG 12901]EHO12883.1 hypothetical protein HMPREF9712_00030 [Myroides odoratimimus CCUG 10230]MCA4793036.1 hypothetical protein [Myroides odoratimimus]MCA4806830.1 hypothetical protein [Myroides odoratimimus]
MSVSTKTIILQFLSFAVLFILCRLAFSTFTALSGFWLPLTSAVTATILAPQFKVFKTDKGDKICMRWIFLKGVKILN